MEGQEVALGPRRSRGRPPVPWLRARPAAVCLTAALAATGSLALAPDKAFHQYRLDHWGTEDGLLQASVITVVQTSDGYLWLGGYEGLERFDGVRFTTFDRSNTPELGDNNVFDLAESGDGSLWIATDGGGLTRRHRGRFVSYTVADGLVDDRVYCLHAARDGGVWIGSKGGLGRFESGSFSSWGTADGLPDAHDLGRLAFEALELVSGRIAERGVEVHISPALPVVTGDRPRLLQLFQNLIDNAVKFMGAAEEPRIEIGAVIDATDDTGCATCYVRDNGSGVDPEFHEKIFGLFNQLEAGAEGAGMGLALVQRIVEVHGGRIWVESEGEGRGSTFYFTLPVAKSDGA